MKNSFVIFSYLNLLCDNNEITDKWLDHRLDLFEAVTLQALKGQSDQDFLYVLACAADTPEPYRSRIQALMPKNGIVHWVTQEQTNYPCKNCDVLVHEKGTDIFRQYIEPDRYGMVWTTHIGSDDSLGVHYVKEMKAAFDFDHFKYHGFLYYPAGYVYYSHEKEFYDVYDASQFFLTLREPFETFRGVLTMRHSHIHRYAPVARVVTGDPMWIKILHSSQIGTYRQWSITWNKKKADTKTVGHNRVKKQFRINIKGIT